MERAKAKGLLDMLIKGEEAENIRRGDSFMEDHFDRDANHRRWTFDCMPANPPFGVTWKQQEDFIFMKKSLGNKRNKIGDPGEPDHSGEITRIHGDFRHDDSRVFSIDGRDKRLTSG